ncbi:TetR/AcrR family transcriptional regulator [Nitriliruptoraceae bacterium ZYF776]|nr:TetR/AcrR family transcriptional regulator [Profundirhabdus halotolerans]
MPADPPPPSAPPTRSQRQEATREALVLAALVAFTRDGFHGANLERIANDAGYSKGAVYSNFDGKADLFLAVMDRNLAAIGEEGWDPFARSQDAPDDADDLENLADALDHRADGQATAEALRGFALATLEFIATAARDEQLAAALLERMQLLLTAYGRVAAQGRPAGEVLPVDDVGALLAALDQGVGLLVLTGIASVDGGLLRTGLQRLLDPARAVEEGPAPSDDGVPPIHDRELQRRVLRDLVDRPDDQSSRTS